MTVDQAYQVLDRVIASLQLNRQEHSTLQQALQLLLTTAKDSQEKKCAHPGCTICGEEDGGTE